MPTFEEILFWVKKHFKYIYIFIVFLFVEFTLINALNFFYRGASLTEDRSILDAFIRDKRVGCTTFLFILGILSYIIKKRVGRLFLISVFYILVIRFWSAFLITKNQSFDKLIIGVLISFFNIIALAFTYQKSFEKYFKIESSKSRYIDFISALIIMLIIEVAFFMQR